MNDITIIYIEEVAQNKIVQSILIESVEEGISNKFDLWQMFWNNERISDNIYEMMFGLTIEQSDERYELDDDGANRNAICFNPMAKTLLFSKLWANIIKKILA